jgi:molybdenum cofactor cytidylyltransferase
MIFAVVPAAGHSTRMGRPKLALPLAGRTVIELVIAALRSGGCHHIVAVIGPHVPQLEKLAVVAGAHVCLLPEPTPDMRATVERGLGWLEERFQPQPRDAWLLAPGDHPTLDAGVVRRLIDEYEHNQNSIIVPTFGGRRGHPSLIPWHHVDAIRAQPTGDGLNAYLRSRASATLEVPVSEQAVLCDLDTPEDYRRLGESFRS